MSKTRIALAVATVALLAIVAFCAAIPLQRSEVTIRTSLLRETPLGSSAVDVRAVVARHGWLNHSYRGQTGYMLQQSGKPAEVVGVSSICGDLGHYGFPFRTDVTAFWGFDESDRLIDVWVWKTTNAL